MPNHTQLYSDLGAVGPDQLCDLRRDFESDPRWRQSMNAVCHAPVSKVARSPRRLSAIDLTFSHHLDENKATSQGASGRCWLFAALNTLRVAAIETMALEDDFELSQNYLMFWDKLEKANYFLESILLTLDEPTDGRLIAHLLTSPVQDGGQWHMFANLVRKYGVVPKAAMPETDSSGRTAELNYQLTYLLREAACRMRQANRRGATEVELRAMKAPVLSEAYRMLAIHLGIPPREFFWQWRDRDNKHHREGTITPLRFFEKYVGVDLDDRVCLIHCPQESKSYGALYTIRFLGNVVGGEPIKYLNVEADVMKAAAANQIKAGEPVWFGCDVGKCLDRESGLMDVDLFEYDLIYGRAPSLTKAERLDYGHAQMTHAMVFTGVDLDSAERPVKWRVENSWGDKVGDEGFMLMTDRWFDEHNYEVVVRRRFLSDSLLPILDTEPIPLDPWDPMGALAC